MHLNHVPGYWKNEVGDELKPAVAAYLHDQALTPRQVHILKLYIKQWIFAPVWQGVEELRQLADRIESEEDISAWCDKALDEGIDPF